MDALYKTSILKAGKINSETMCCCLLFQHVSVLCRYLFIASLCSLINMGCGLLPNMLNCRPCGYSTRSDPAFKVSNGI